MFVRYANVTRAIHRACLTLLAPLLLCLAAAAAELFFFVLGNRLIRRGYRGYLLKIIGRGSLAPAPFFVLGNRLIRRGYFLNLNLKRIKLR